MASNLSMSRIPKINQRTETGTYCKSICCSSTVGSIEKGAVLSVCVTVTAASLLTGVDMWSERSAGGRLALWPCSPEAWSSCPLADVTYWSRLSCHVTACYPPPPSPSSPTTTHTNTPTHTQTQTCTHSNLRNLLSCCSPSPLLHPPPPTIFIPWETH